MPVNNPQSRLSKILASTRVLTAASGDVAYTGIGFRPNKITAFTEIPSTLGGSQGFSDMNGLEQCQYQDAGGLQASAAALLFCVQSGVAYQYAVLKTYDADGFTLTWTKSGAPTLTADLNFLCEG